MPVGKTVRSYLIRCVLAAAALGAAGLLGAAYLGRHAFAADAAPVRLDAAKVMGPKACVDCHKPEIAAWQASRHAVNFDKLADNPNAQKYAAALGVTRANIVADGLCVNCHGQKAEATAVHTITGVSCESCHGPSGGEGGWYNAHGSYGAKGLTREQETPEHKKMRQEAADKAGMVRPAHIYAMAKNCLGCHAVPNEELVNKAGHKAGSADFELATWAAGDVAHNLFLDPKKNADAPSLWMAETGRKPAERKRLLYVFGKVADLEISLRNLAAASQDGTYSQAMADRAKKAASDLGDIQEIVPEVKPALDEFKKIKLKLKPANKDAILSVADKVAAAAPELEKNQDGSKLADLDGVIAQMGNGPRFTP